MHFQRTLSSVYVLFACLHVCTCSEQDENGFTKESMTKMVQSMLGFKEIPHSNNVRKEAPQYMLDLYNRFKDRPISVGQRNSNTVRSIQAKIGTVNGQQMFVFNLSSLKSTQQMVSAEIHLYKRRKDRYNKQADLELNTFEIAPHYTADRSSFKINIASHGWQWYDVTDDVTSCVSQRRVPPHSLGINFRITKLSGKINVYDLKRFTQHHSTPYLIIYSNDSDDLNIESIDRQSESVKSDDMLNSESDAIIPQRIKRNKRSLSDNSADLPIYPSHSRSLSILTNEIPEVPDEFRPYPRGSRINIKTHPGMLQTRKETRHRLTDTRLIPYPGDNINKRKRKKQRRRKKNKNKKSRNRNSNKLDLPKKWDNLEALAEDDKSRDLCGRKKLILDFNDIGWGDWVISPKSFKAHYCSGRCPFPLTKKLRPTNHATIQSLVNAVNPNVPAPCCSPEKLSSITLLYFDENGNVVLKNYPNMTVRKCGCR